MTNHVHLITVPERPEAFAEALGRLHGVYAQQFHKRWGDHGHFWQNRYFSCPLDRDGLWTALRYVDLNPLRAGMVKDAAEYEWSSARPHAEGSDALRLLDLGLWKQVSRGQDWNDVLAPTRDEEAAEIAALRHATRTGRPLGGDGFMKRLQATFCRKLNAKRTGRPKKAQAAAAGKK